MTTRTLRCRSCPAHGMIRCRDCGREMCKHFATSVTTPDGRQYDPVRDPRPAYLLGTCTACRLKK